MRTVCARSARSPAAGRTRSPMAAPRRASFRAFDERLRGEIRQIAGVPATTATDSIFAACRALGLQRVTAISPYTEAVDAAEHRFFAEGGIETVARAHLGIADGFRLAEP